MFCWFWNGRFLFWKRPIVFGRPVVPGILGRLVRVDLMGRCGSCSITQDCGTTPVKSCSRRKILEHMYLSSPRLFQDNFKLTLSTFWGTNLEHCGRDLYEHGTAGHSFWNSLQIWKFCGRWRSSRNLTICLLIEVDFGTTKVNFWGRWNGSRMRFLAAEFRPLLGHRHGRYRHNLGRWNTSRTSSGTFPIRINTPLLEHLQNRSTTLFPLSKEESTQHWNLI